VGGNVAFVAKVVLCGLALLGIFLSPLLPTQPTTSMTDSVLKDTWPPVAKKGKKGHRAKVARVPKLKGVKGTSRRKEAGGKRIVSRTRDVTQLQRVRVPGGAVFMVTEQEDLDPDHARLDARMRGVLREIIKELSPAAVGMALETRGPVSALGVILDELIKERPDLVELDPIGEVTAQVAAIHKALIKRAGGAYTTAEAAEVLGTSTGAVRKRVQRDTLLAFQTASGEHRLPVAQFKPGGTIEGLEEVLAAMHVSDPWMRIQLFLDNDVLGSLKAGRIEYAVEAVNAYLPEDEGEPL